MKLPEDFFHWQVIFSVRPPQQTVTMFVGKLVRSVVKTEKIGSAIARSLLAVAFIATLASASAAAQPREQQFNIPKQAVDQALDALATQANVFLLFPYDQVLAVDANPVKGKYSIQQALDILLKNTGLSGDLTQGGVITISPNDLNQNGKGKRMNINKRKNLLATFIAVFAAGATTQGAVAQDGEAATAQSGIDEIIVTATRRATSLQDTALSIAAIGDEEISRRNLTGMEDYLRTMPGVNFTNYGVGDNAVVIRGISIDPQQEGGQSSPTTGIYFGEVSIGGAGPRSGNPDLRLIDLERVEVLRGPQGTLFGSSALAGAVRNIPNAPDLQETQGSIKAGFSNTGAFGGDNTKIEAVVNIPLIDDVLAVRAVAYRHDNSGYFKNIAGTQLANDGLITPAYTAGSRVAAFGSANIYQDEDDVGSATYTGGRIAVLWQPIDDLSVTLQHVRQEAEQEGGSFEQLIFEPYTHASLQFGNNIPADGVGTKDDFSLTNLVVEYDLGWATLLSSSSWLEDDGESNSEVSSFISGIPAAQLNHSAYENFTEELRLVSQLEGNLQYVVGVFYEDFERNTDQDIYSIGDLALSPLGTPFGSGNPLAADQYTNRSVEQLAFYGELSYELTEQLTLTGGLRRFDYERDQEYFVTGALGSAARAAKIDEDGTNLKANLSYQANDDTLLYAQWSEGFRLGNVTNPPPAATCDTNNDGILDGTDVPLNPFFESDSVESIEIGAKLSLLDSRMQVNAAVYQVDWKDIPLRVFSPAPCSAGITANAGDARSEGAEIEAVYQITEGFRVSLGGAYTSPELTGIADGFTSSFTAGDRLPSSPEYSANFGLQYEFDWGGHASYVRGDYAYIDKFYSLAGEAGDEAGDYDQINLNAGITVNQFNIELYVQNLTDEDSLTAVGVLTPNAAAYRLRPRTVGLTVGYEF